LVPFRYLGRTAKIIHTRTRMKTEKPKETFQGNLARIPIFGKLQVIVVVFACVFFALLGLVHFSLGFSSAARAYVQGEGTWSKAQKEATIRLQRYAVSRDERDYQAYLDCLSVQLGDRMAREEMEKPDPNYAKMYTGFRQGKIAEADIPGMIALFRRLRKTKEIDTAVRIWTTADGYIEEFRQQGAQMRAEGYEALEAENGEEALAIASRHKGDMQLLLTDVIMPKLRGPELASRLRMRYPGMKVIYMSGYTESALVQDGMLERNTVLLQKPFTAKTILEVIREMNVSERS
jgi:CheY-like chemotaxis protein